MLVLFLLLYLFFIFIRPHEYIAFLHGVPVTLSLLVAATAFWFISSDKQELSKLPQVKLIFLLPISMFISNLFGGWITKGVEEFLHFLPISVLFVLIISSFNTIGKLRLLILVVISSSLILAVHGVFQSIDGVGWTGVELLENRIRYVGIFNDPNDLGLFFVLSFPMIIYCYKTSVSKIFRLLMQGTFVVVLYATYLTNSRGSILAVLAMLAVYMKHKYGTFKMVMLGVLCSPFILFLPSRMSKVSASEESAAGRVYAWYQGFQMFFSNPLTGIGAGRFTDYHFRTAHNSFVLVISEMGIIGYFLWFMLLILTFSLVYNIKEFYSKYSPSNDTTEIVIVQRVVDFNTMLYYSFIGLFVTMFFLSRSYTIVLYVFLATVIAYFQMLRHSEGYSSLNDVFNAAWLKYFAYSLLSVFGFYIVVKILLLMV